MNIFFDLDGTLIDAKDRLYQLFQYLVPNSRLSFDEYWRLKQNKVSHKEILNKYFSYTEAEFASFECEWMLKIEHPDWLALDKPFSGLTEHLKKLANKYTLYVITARQFDEGAVSQIKKNGWDGIFKDILITNHVNEKVDLIKANVITTVSDWFVGDTGKDIQAGKQLGINTAAVLSGFLSRKVLEEYQPNVIVNSVLDLNLLGTYSDGRIIT